MRARLSKINCQKRISEYQKRRSEYWKEAKSLKGNDAEYAIKRVDKIRSLCAGLTLKMESFRRAIRKYNKVESYLSEVDKVFSDISGYRMRGIHKMKGEDRKKGEYLMYRRMFSKWCLENGVSSYHIRLYIGLNKTRSVVEHRIIITKQIVGDSDTRLKWNLIKSELANLGLNKYKN